MKKTSLTLAACKGNKETVKYLVDQEASIEATEEYLIINKELLELLNGKPSSKSAIEIIKIFENKKLTIDNILDEDRNTTLILAAYYGHIEIVKYLVEQSANIEAANSNGDTALIIAAHKGHIGIVKYLIEKLANIEAANSNEDTALILAACNGQIEVVKHLIDKRANIEATNIYGDTALILAACNGHVGIVKYLVAKNTNKESANSNGDTALIIAAYSGKIEIVKHLVTNGANAETKNNNEYTALIFAASQGHVGIVKYLVAKNVNKESANSNGDTALIIATDNGNRVIVEYLVNKDADIEAANSNGDTALIIATANGDREVLEYLVANNANKESANSNGITALILAEISGHREVVEYLVKAQADNYYTKSLNNIPAVLIRDPCPITQEEIKNPVFLKNSENKSLYEISAIVSWLFRYDTNPLTREKISMTKEIFRERLEGPATKEGIIPEKIHTEILEGQERLTYILKTVLCYPMKPIIVFIKNSCKILKRMAQGRNKYRAMITQMILQKMIMDFRVKPVVNIQALARGRHIRFKYKKSEFKSESLQIHNSKVSVI